MISQLFRQSPITCLMLRTLCSLNGEILFDTYIRALSRVTSVWCSC